MRHLWVQCVVLIGVFGAGSSFGREVPRYHLQDLGIPPDAVLSGGRCLNNRGEVAGYVEDEDDFESPFLFKDGQMTVLGLPSDVYTDGFATDINERGVVVGINRGHHDFDSGFIYKDGRLHSLSNLLGFPIVAGAVGINNRNWIVGSAMLEDHGTAFGFLYKYGVKKVLPPLIPGGHRSAVDINDAGQIIGTAQSSAADETGAWDAHAVIYFGVRIIDLGTLGGGRSSSGAAINQFGHAVGFSNLGQPNEGGYIPSHAFLYRRGRMIDLGALEGDFYSYAYGINDRDQVVGVSVSVDGETRGALFMDGAVHDLNALLDSPSDLVIEQATDINNGGVIVASARQNRIPYILRAVLLTPVRE